MSRFTEIVRFPALALGLALAAGILVGCAGDDASTDAPAAQQPTAEVAPTSPPTQPQPEMGHETGQRAPDFMVSTAGGEQLTLDSFQGRPVVLYFFATW